MNNPPMNVDTAERVLVLRYVSRPDDRGAIESAVHGARFFEPATRDAYDLARWVVEHLGADEPVSISTFTASLCDRGFDGVISLADAFGYDDLESLHLLSESDDAYRIALSICRGEAQGVRIVTGVDELNTKFNAGTITAAELRKGIDALVGTGHTRSVLDAANPRAVAQDAIQRFGAQRNGDAPQLLTGVSALDDLLSLRTGLYGLLVGESGAGKSTFAGDMCIRLHEQSGAVISWHSCEIDPAVQMWRLGASMMSALDDKTLRLDERWCIDPALIQREGASQKQEREHYEKMSMVKGWFEKSRVYLHPAGTIDVSRVEQAADELVLMYPDRPVVMVVDYIQDAHAGKASTQLERVDAASRALRDVARKYRQQVSIIALAQVTDPLKPNVGESDKGTPVPNSKKQIRDSRSVYHQADFSMVVHRPWQVGGMSQCCMVQVDKNRYGRPMHTAVKLDLRYKSIQPWDGATPSGVRGLYTEQLRARRY